jgi:hypothetical protein
MSVCGGCGSPLEPSRGPTPRRWCSDACRKKAERAELLELSAVEGGGTHAESFERTVSALEMGVEFDAVVTYGRGLAR